MIKTCREKKLRAFNKVKLVGPCCHIARFMENIHGKAMTRWVQSIIKIVARRLDSDAEEKEILFVKTPPPVDWHLTRDKQEFSLMTLHPVEIARQITLIESGA